MLLFYIINGALSEMEKMAAPGNGKYKPTKSIDFCGWKEKAGTPLNGLVTRRLIKRPR